MFRSQNLHIWGLLPQSALKKVSAPSFRLSGGGWYETDFKTGKQKNLAGEASQTDGAAKASDTGSDKTATSSGESKKSSDAPGKTTAA